MSVPEPMPVAQLRHDRAGRAVPWFVAWVDGKPDFRVQEAGKQRLAIERGLCWVNHDGILLDIGEPRKVEWYAEGREATRAEVLASIQSGTPFLRELAVEEGDEAMRHLDLLLDAVLELVPA
jgi:hypothetical protein